MAPGFPVDKDAHPPCPFDFMPGIRKDSRQRKSLAIAAGGVLSMPDLPSMEDEFEHADSDKERKSFFRHGHRHFHNSRILTMVELPPLEDLGKDSDEDSEVKRPTSARLSTDATSSHVHSQARPPVHAQNGALSRLLALACQQLDQLEEGVREKERAVQDAQDALIEEKDKVIAKEKEIELLKAELQSTLLASSIPNSRESHRDALAAAAAAANKRDQSKTLTDAYLVKGSKVAAAVAAAAAKRNECKTLTDACQGDIFAVRKEAYGRRDEKELQARREEVPRAYGRRDDKEYYARRDEVRRQFNSAPEQTSSKDKAKPLAGKDLSSLEPTLTKPLCGAASTMPDLPAMTEDDTDNSKNERLCFHSKFAPQCTGSSTTRCTTMIDLPDLADFEAGEDSEDSFDGPEYSDDEMDEKVLTTELPENPTLVAPPQIVNMIPLVPNDRNVDGRVHKPTGKRPTFRRLRSGLSKMMRGHSN